MVDTTIPMHAAASEPVIDANFAARLAVQRKAAGITQQTLANRAAIHVTQVRRYEAGTSQPTLDVSRALALNTSTGSLLFDDTDRCPTILALRLKLKALDRLDPDEQAHVTALFEGALLGHDSRSHFTGQAS